jgi:hypothetical protein
MHYSVIFVLAIGKSRFGIEAEELADHVVVVFI